MSFYDLIQAGPSALNLCHLVECQKRRGFKQKIGNEIINVVKELNEFKPWINYSSTDLGVVDAIASTDLLTQKPSSHFNFISTIKLTDALRWGRKCYSKLIN